MQKTKLPDHIFAGIFSTGIFYANKKVEEHGDWKRLAALYFSDLRLEVEKSCSVDNRKAIEAHAAEIQSRVGQSFQISTAGQSITLGYQLLKRLPSRIEGQTAITALDDTSEVTSASGLLTITEGVSSTFPRLVDADISIILEKGAELILPLSEKISGDITLYEGARLDMPRCRFIGGYVTLQKHSAFLAPACVEIDYSIDIPPDAETALDSLETIASYLWIGQGQDLTFPRLIHIGESLKISSGAKVHLPLCREICAGIEHEEGASYYAPLISPSTPVRPCELD